ncbi:MAG: hypothetical protein HKN24_09110 [Acidimicrobiales bacterium]|nr:hypothetical protein [Acidimicrobiales bacterium]
MGDTSDLLEGGFVVDGDTEWFRIKNYDHLDPFLMTVVTSDDQWMYVSSSGALAAGRHSAEHSLFPYETDDRLHRAAGLTGPLTVIRVGDEVWEPFASSTPLDVVRRSIAKSVTGDQLRFTEHNPELGLSFSYTWTTAGEFGLVRRCELAAEPNRSPITVEILDGLVNILPAGVELSAQQQTSTLVDAYRRSELDGTAGLALFTLEALVSDKADPAEALSATTVWHLGFGDPTIALSDSQVRAFRSGNPLDPEHLVIGRKGAYLVSTSITVDADAPANWTLVADVGQDHVDISRLRRRLRSDDVASAVRWAIHDSHQSLQEIVSAADGIQVTNDRRATVHHFANVLFNCMRGGTFPADHRVEIADVARFVEARNDAAHDRFVPIAASLDPIVEIDTLRTAVDRDVDLSRLVSEYLPLTFSRRHGDPSRPWNKFEISTRTADGDWALGYEGNWRDIFQNWDALMHSFPLYFESAVAKFLNASTLDGNNPYRITDDGIDWEVPEHGSWGNFGYWGDHQIVYLHRLLSSAERFQPKVISAQLGRRAFSYGDVPYRIAPYSDLVDDPKHTIEFDDEAQLQIDERVRSMGTDGRLVPDADGERVHHASLVEKLLVPAMAKLSNLVAGAGIWMNTQRPEWNDANNALVGNGVSTVTAFHLYDYLGTLEELLRRSPTAELPIGSALSTWLGALHQQFEAHSALSDPAEITPSLRRSLLDGIGLAYSEYRAEVYRKGPGRTEPVIVDDLLGFLASAQRHLGAVIAAAERPDGLFHSYWLLELATRDRADIEPLYEMLEGQVAALSSSTVDPARAVELVESLFQSDLYRADQHTFVLYPNRATARFMDKNRLPASSIGPAVTALAASASDLIRRDDDGVLRFASRLRSARYLEAELDDYPPAERDEILAAYEATFNHHAFTGRSQTMYKYEGLGSVYWHMVSKLVFALQEKINTAVEQDAPSDTVRALCDQYRRLRAGLGFAKSVAEQGTFPTDPHSHTPSHLGAQQPGMTGQVKEGVLIRWSELGVHVDDGCVSFRPVLLDPGEFLEAPREWDAIEGQLEARSLGFTYCGVPVIYRLGTAQSCRAVWSDGTETSGVAGFDRVTSAALFSRTGQIKTIDVTVELDS